MLSKRSREILVVAMADKKAAKEVADAIDAAQAADLSDIEDAISDLQDQAADHEARIAALEA